MTGRSVPKIFLSSTSYDLPEERNIAVRAIRQNYFPINMEHWGASPEKPREKILEELNQAAAVVLILGFKYGSLMDDEDISYTEFEFNKAKEEGLKILSFIKLGEDGEWHNDEDDEKIKAKLNNFESKLQQHSTVDYFKAGELEEKILLTLSKNDDKIQANKDFTDKFFERHLINSIHDLGERYSPKINVNLDLDFFNAMAKNESFKKAFNYKFIEYYCELIRFKMPSEFAEEYVNAIEKFKDEKEIINDISYDFNRLGKLIKNIKECLIIASTKFKEGSDEKHDLDVLIYKSNEFMDDLIKFPFKLLKNPILILTGVAGAGKSHLLADLACERLKNSEVSILLLGSHFNSNDKIEKQIVEELELPMSSSNFLEKLNNKAKHKKSRIFIMIDALNECKDKSLWENRLRSFIHVIKRYEWLGLIVSIRSTYLDIIPEDIIRDNCKFTHPKFEYKIFEALETFCNDSGVNYPSFPILNPEFSNPLFLKLLFTNIKKSHSNRIPQDSVYFPTIVNNFLDNIEHTIQKNPAIPNGFNITRMFVRDVIKLKISNNNSDLSYQDLFNIGKNICDNLNINNFQIIDVLIKEGLFHKDRFSIKFSYESIGDYLIADYLLEDMGINELLDAFGKNGHIYNIINSDPVSYFGVFEFFAILIPEKFGLEIFEIDFSQFEIFETINDNMFYWFINSLYWRKPESIKDKVHDYVESEIDKSDSNFTLFFESLILLSSNPEYIFNAEKLHEILLKNPMPIRDSFWLLWINDQYRHENSVYRIVRWVLSIEDIGQIDDEILKLLSLTLSWFLSSNNKKLRDESTYAIIRLLKNKLNIVMELLKKFEGVDDIYIIERLFAVAYGCVLNCDNLHEIKVLADYTYDSVYLREIFQSNILLKDYTQCILDYANMKLGNVYSISKCGDNIIPIRIPSDNEIDLIKNQFLKDDDVNGGIYILGSLNKNWGDLGHKEFKSKFKYWEPEFSYEDLEKIMIKRIFGLYDEKLHGDFDVYLERNKYPSIYPHTIRIGEKYQRIVFYELLDQLSANYMVCESWKDDAKHFLRGSWEISVRDFDPTFNLKNQLKTIGSTSNLINFNIDDEVWSESIDDLPEIECLLNPQNLFGENDDWLLLYGQINLNNSNKFNFNCNKPTKGFYLDLVGLIIKKEEKDEILEKLKFEEISSLLPYASNFFQVFDKEYSWASSYNDLKFENEFEELDYLNFEDKNVIHMPFDENVWDFDHYLDDDFNMNVLKPSGLIFNKMGLEYGEKDNVLYSNGVEIVVDLSNHDNFEYRLIINKKEFISFLNRNDFDILWLVSGAKITYENWAHDYDKELYLRGFYYWDDDYNVVGNINYNHFLNAYVGDKKSKKFHINYCSHVDSIEKEDIVEFKTIEDASNNGFNPCLKCITNTKK